MSEKFMKRIPDLKTQNEDIRTFIAHSDDFVEAKFNPAIDKAFAESVSLAVTQVNGCSICSYAHTKNALKAGMTEDEIESLLDGGFDHAPKEQLEALLFAQHYAESRGDPDPETKTKLLEIYGEEKTKDIMSHIYLIMLSNLHGNTMEAFKLRLKGKGVEASGFWQELSVIINFFKIMPVLLLKMLQYKLLNEKRDRKVINRG